MSKNVLFFPLIIIIVIVLGYAFRVTQALKTQQTIAEIQSERESLLLITPTE